MLLLGCAAIGVFLEKLNLVDFLDFGVLSAEATSTAGSALPALERRCISAMSALFHDSACMRATLVPRGRAVLAKRARRKNFTDEEDMLF
jgi:hypothetical protein